MRTKRVNGGAEKPGAPGVETEAKPIGKAGNKSKVEQVGPEVMLSRVRRETGAGSLLAFVRTYLPHYFKKEPSAMHLELVAELERMQGDRGSRLAVAAPRGHAKSTLVTLCYVLWSVVYRRERFIVIVSDTADQARDHLAHIKNELESNQRLLSDFPEACEVPPGPTGTVIKPPSTRWRKDDISTRHGVRVFAVGSGQRLRGKRYKDERPTLIILDDVENEESVRSAEQREQKMEWFTSTVTKAGTGTTNLIIVGTVLHTESLLAKALDSSRMPGWRAMRYRAMLRWPERMDLWDTWEGVYNHREEFEGRSGPEASRRFFAAHQAEMERGSEVLWPQVDPLIDLMTLRTRDGAPSFEREKQNEPGGMEHTVFRETDFHYWDDLGKVGPAPVELSPHGRRGEWSDPVMVRRASSAEELMSLADSNSRVIIGVDPSLGLPGAGAAGRDRDNSAIVVLLHDWRTELNYVLEADISRRRPADLVAHLVRLARHYKAWEIGVEAVQFQSLLGSNLRDELERQRLGRVHVRDVKQTANKTVRIQGMQPSIVSGRVLFSRRQVSLLNELLTFPYGSHDDGPDALEIALRCAQEPVGRAVEIYYGEGD